MKVTDLRNALTDADMGGLIARGEVGEVMIVDGRLFVEDRTGRLKWYWDHDATRWREFAPVTPPKGGR